MYSFSTIVLALVSTVVAAPNALPNRTPTVYLAGDSTMAEGGGGGGTQGQEIVLLRSYLLSKSEYFFLTLIRLGWGHYLQYSLSVPVVNKAVAGRSARSYTVEGRFQAIADLLAAGDFVVIEFGHNDAGSLTPTDNGRTDCPGAGTEICTSIHNKKAETVLTYPAYITNAGKLFTAKGAKVVVSSPTPNNPWETGTFLYAPSRFTTYSSASATAIGSAAAFVDHSRYVANIFQTLGAKVVDAYYPIGHTHTSPVGADTVAKAFVKGLKCGGSALSRYVKNSTSSIQGRCI